MVFNTEKFEAKKLDAEIDTFLNKVDKPALIQPIYSENKKIIDDKRAELELKKLEIEIEKLSTPNTNIDYFKQMLDLQQNHFNQLLEMEKRHGSLQLEIEKLKLGSDDGDDTILSMMEMFKPMLPQLLNKGVEKPKMDKEQYLSKMRDGSITPEMGYDDFKMEFPDLAKNMSFDTFKLQFENIKTNGLPK